MLHMLAIVSVLLYCSRCKSCNLLQQSVQARPATKYLYLQRGQLLRLNIKISLIFTAAISALHDLYGAVVMVLMDSSSFNVRETLDSPCSSMILK